MPSSPTSIRAWRSWQTFSGIAPLLAHSEGAAPSYVAGTSIFYAVTRYNWSSYYALAVVELGEAVRAARDRPS